MRFVAHFHRILDSAKQHRCVLTIIYWFGVRTPGLLRRQAYEVLVTNAFKILAGEETEDVLTGTCVYRVDCELVVSRVKPDTRLGRFIAFP